MQYASVIWGATNLKVVRSSQGRTASFVQNFQHSLYFLRASFVGVIDSVQAGVRFLTL